jgi:hypothetical protein
MTISLLFLIIAAILFVLSVLPKVSRAWMVGIGLALVACSFMPYFSGRIG